MPNLQNAKKALRQANKRASRNKARASKVDSLRRQFRLLLDAGKTDDAKKLLSSLYAELDKATKHNIVKKNAASRVKSRLTKRLNKAGKK